MKVDDRGRIRFMYNGTRYDLTSTGFGMYERFQGREVERGFLDNAQTLYFAMQDPEFKDKLGQALNLLAIRDVKKQYTTAIHVPTRNAGEF